MEIDAVNADYDAPAIDLDQQEETSTWNGREVSPKPPAKELTDLAIDNMIQEPTEVTLDEAKVTVVAQAQESKAVETLELAEAKPVKAVETVTAKPVEIVAAKPVEVVETVKKAEPKAVDTVETIAATPVVANATLETVIAAG